jgi:hypothetical protein
VRAKDTRTLAWVYRKGLQVHICHGTGHISISRVCVDDALNTPLGKMSTAAM